MNRATKLFTMLLLSLIVLHSLTGCTMTDNWAYRSAVKANTPTAFEQYIEKHPKGRHRQEAMRWIDDYYYTAAKRAHSVEAYRSYLGRELHAKHHVQEAMNAIDDLVYNLAKSTGTVRAYESYLSGYADAGRHGDEARAEIKRIYAADKQAIAQARAYERRCRWQDALDHWNTVKETDVSGAISRCNERLQNPVVLDDESIQVRGYYEMEGKRKRYYRVVVTGRITNYTPTALEKVLLDIELSEGILLTLTSKTYTQRITSPARIPVGKTISFECDFKVNIYESIDLQQSVTLNSYQ